MLMVYGFVAFKPYHVAILSNWVLCPLFCAHNTTLLPTSLHIFRKLYFRHKCWHNLLIVTHLFSQNQKVITPLLICLLSLFYTILHYYTQFYTILHHLKQFYTFMDTDLKKKTRKAQNYANTNNIQRERCCYYYNICIEGRIVNSCCKSYSFG